MKRFLFIFITLLILSSSAFTQTDVGLKSVGAKIGFIVPDTMDETIGLGLLADLGSIDMFSLSANIDYWSKSYTKNYQWDWKWDVISVAVVGKYSFNLQSPIKPYVGAGMGFDLTSWKSEYNPTVREPLNREPEASESNFDLAVHLIGGVKYTISSVLDGFAKVKYTTGGIDYFGAHVGVMYKLK